MRGGTARVGRPDWERMLGCRAGEQAWTECDHQFALLLCRGPAYTVHLEIAYKSKIEAGRTILCTTEVESLEGRKLWMKVRWWGRAAGAGAGKGWPSVPASQLGRLLARAVQCPAGTSWPTTPCRHRLANRAPPACPPILLTQATVSDGPQGTVYATARALFVAPRPQKALVDVGKYLLRRVMGDM